MSNIITKNGLGDEVKLSVKDTDFLLKLIMRSDFAGSEVEIAYQVIQKLSKLHRKHLED